MLILLADQHNAIKLLPNRDGAEEVSYISPRMLHIGPRDWEFEITAPISVDVNDTDGKYASSVKFKNL